MALPYGVLAHKFLKQCQCFSAVQTTQSACNFNWTKTRKYKKKIQKVFSDLTKFSSIVQDKQSIKVEPTYHQDAF